MEKKKFFGTDGMRGTVGTFPITADFVLKFGWAVGQTLKEFTLNTPTILIGKDTRISGYMIESALEAGLSAAGCRVLLVGPMPTPAIAYLTQTLRADLGVVISASHNHFADNGIKLFSAHGLKISEEIELLIESFFEKPMTTLPAAALGKASRIDDAAGRYIEFCKSTIPHYTRFNGLNIIVDCANGATYKTAPHVFTELGANVITMHRTPNGININEQCGSNHPHALQEKVLKEKADLGIAFDGDGDRVIIVDHLGDILDGDDLLYIILKGTIASKHFSGGIVGTILTNSGFEHALQNMSVQFQRVPVGDQHVIEKLLETGWILGGEPSGHIIYLPVTTTADGIITALQVLLASKQLNMNVHDIKKTMKKIPQKSINLPYQKKKQRNNPLPIEKWTAHCHTQLNGQGRVVIRASGTEPLIRIMIEHIDLDILERMSTYITNYIQSELNNIT